MSNYKFSKTLNKGATEGSWAVIIAAIVGLGINSLAPDMEPEAKASAVAVITGGIVAGIRGLRNWWKHRND